MDLFDVPQRSSAFSSSPLPHLLSRTLLRPSAYLRLLASMFLSLFLLYLHEYYYKCRVRQNNSTCSKKSVNQCNTSLKLFKMLGRRLPWTRAQSQLYGPVVQDWDKGQGVAVERKVHSCIDFEASGDAGPYDQIGCGARRAPA
jgi:hypothetical protein